jgi:hypothetical protein
VTVAIRCRTYKELRETLAARRKALGWTQLECDHKSGLQDQYTGKLEIGTRHLGSMSMEVLLQTLDLEMYIGPRSDAAPVAERRWLGPCAAGMFEHRALSKLDEGSSL